MFQKFVSFTNINSVAATGSTSESFASDMERCHDGKALI
jgi:hypothetical protein